jgi:hypothetical protein
MDLPDIQIKRMKFLREYVTNLNLKKGGLTPVFIDETWIFSKGSLRNSWQDDSNKTCYKKTGEGNLII